MRITYIAHAGICIEENGVSVLIDPWFFDSTLTTPIVESVSGIRTIDFQIPKARAKIEAYHPDAILLSHFHAHHSPFKDIQQLIQQSKKLIIAHPDTEANARVAEKLTPSSTELLLKPCRHKNVFKVGPFLITALEHTTPKHLAWSVESISGHVLHIADPRLHSERLHTIDPLWDGYTHLKPDILFLSACRSSLRIQNGLKREILENAGLAPIQGAELTKYLQPKSVVLIGMHNHSVWKNYTEYRGEASATEDEFAWALEWLAPEIKHILIRPSHTFGLGKKEYAASVDTLLI